MHGARRVSSPSANNAIPSPEYQAISSSSRSVGSLRNSLAILSSNHRFPRSPAEGLRQVLCNTISYLGSLIRTNPQGIETPVLAAAQLVTIWAFCSLRNQATRQLPQLMRAISDNNEINNFLYQINLLALTSTTIQDITDYVVSHEEWLHSLTPEERIWCREYVQKLTDCVENMTFWRPRSTLLLPVISSLAPYLSVALNFALPHLTAASSLMPSRQRLNASAVLAGETEGNGDFWFAPEKTVLNLPGDISLPPLMLHKGQSLCLRVPKCPSEGMIQAGNQTTGFDIAGFGIEANLATRVCISNDGIGEMEIHRDLYAAASPYISRLYRHPLQIAGLSAPASSGICPVPQSHTSIPLADQLERLPDREVTRQKLTASSSGWNLLPVVGAQWSAGEANDVIDLNPLDPGILDWDDYQPTDNDDQTSPSSVTSTASLSAAEQIDYEVNLFNRDKRVFLPFALTAKTRTTTGAPGTTMPVPVTTPDMMTRLFGRVENSKSVGSCRVKHTPLLARDLNDMLTQARDWLRQVTPQHIDHNIHAFFGRMTGNALTQRSQLDEIVSVTRKLVMQKNHQYKYDETAVSDFAMLLFRHSHFAYNKELLDAWARSPEGKQQLTNILFDALDRSLFDAGVLLSASLNTLRQVVRPDSTSFSSLANIQVDLQNAFKNNFIAVVTSSGAEPPLFIENEIALEKLQFIHLEFIKNHFPCFRLKDKLDVSDDTVLSNNGLLLTVAAGVIADESKLINTPRDKLIQFGIQALLRLSDDYVLEKFSYLDYLLKKRHFRMEDYLNTLQTEGGLLVRSLYLNNKILQLLRQDREQNNLLNTDFQALADVEKKLCILSLEQIPDIDQDFFLHASREPLGLEVCFITSASTTEINGRRHFIGFTLAANSERITRCYTVSEIPALNNLAAPLTYDDSAHYQSKKDFSVWINHQGKENFATRLSPLRNGSLSQITFFVGDNIIVPAARIGESWHSYIQNLSQSIINQRFPQVSRSTTQIPSSGSLNSLINFTGNLVSQFMPITHCKQALDDITEGLNTAKKALLTLEDAALCLYDLTPEGEGSRLAKVFAYVARSVIGKITDDIKTETKLSSLPTGHRSLNIPLLHEQIYLEDDQVKHFLANSTQFNNDFSWMLDDNSLDIGHISSEVKLVDVHWNMITDQIYCRINTTQGIKNYRLDQENILLLPSNHKINEHEENSQKLTFNASDFLTRIRMGTLDTLKISRLEQAMRAPAKYASVFFKKEFNEIDFSTANITDLFFKNLVAPPGWKPVTLWVKNDDGNRIITEWRDNKGHTQFEQLSVFRDFFRAWRGEPISHSLEVSRTKRAVTTRSPFYTDIISPGNYGYKMLNTYSEHQRATAIKALVEEGKNLPEPPHFAEIACRNMMKELNRILPYGYLKQKYPAASEFMEKFIRWEVPALISSGFKKFRRAIEIFHENNPTEDVFYPKASQLIKKIEELDAKIKTFKYRNQAWKDKLDLHYEKFIAREINVNRRINKIVDKIHASDIEKNGKYKLQTKSSDDIKNKYPALFARITASVKELHSQAKVIKDLFNNGLHPKMMEEVLLEYTGQHFTREEVRSFTSDFRRLQNNILSITPDRFRVFEERVAKDGKLVSGCFKDEAEKIFFGTGDIAFTTVEDSHKYIYIQNILDDDFFRQIVTHEIDHINNGLNFSYTPPEVYIESYNRIKKFSFSGLELYGKELLSDRDHFVDYLMRDSEFLGHFCNQLLKHARDSVHRLKIGSFRQKYLGKYAPLYINRFGENAELKRMDLRELMDIAYNNHQFLLYFLKQNADFMVSLWHRVANLTQEHMNSEQVIDQGALEKFELLKSLVLKAGAALLDDVNVGASTSTADQANSG